MTSMNKIEAMKAMLDGHQVTNKEANQLKVYYYEAGRFYCADFETNRVCTHQDFSCLPEDGWEIYAPKDIIRSADELKQRVREAVDGKHKLAVIDPSQRVLCFITPSYIVGEGGQVVSYYDDAISKFDLFSNFELEVVE